MNFVRVHDAEKPNYLTNRDYSKTIEALFSLACKFSFEKGGGGYIGFKPKNTDLKNYYEKIGAKWIAGDQWAIRENIALIILNKYYGNTRRP